MREKHPLGRRLLALTAAVCTLGSLAVAPAANAEQATPNKPMAQQTAPSDPGTQQTTPQAGTADGAQKPETGTDTQPGNAGKPEDTNTQQKPAAGNGDGGSADAAGQVIPLDAAHFPDAKFRDIVAKFDTDKDRELSQAERDAVTDINAAADVEKNPLWDLKSAKGVEYFPNLKTLNLSSTGITSLDLSDNPELTTLDLRTTWRLSELNISSNSKLITLNMDFSALKTIDFPNAPALDLRHSSFLGTQAAVTGGPIAAHAVKDVSIVGGHRPSYNGKTVNFLNGFYVWGDSVDIAQASGLPKSQIEGRLLVATFNKQADKYEYQPVDGTVIRAGLMPDSPNSAFYLYKMDNGDALGVKVVFMGALDKQATQQHEAISEIIANNNEFTTASWSDYQTKWWTGLYMKNYKDFFDRFDAAGSISDSWTFLNADMDTMFTKDDDGFPAAENSAKDLIPVMSELDGHRGVLRVQPRDVPDLDGANAVTVPSMKFASYHVAAPKDKPLTLNVDGQDVTVNAGQDLDVSGRKLVLRAGQTIVITAEARTGYQLADPADKWQWMRTGETQTVAPKEPVQSGDVLTVSPVTGVEYFYTYDESGKDLQPFDGQTSIRVGGRPVWVVAKPAKGYQFVDSKPEVTYGPYSYTAPNPPDNGGGNGGNNGGSGDNGNNNGGTTTPSATIVDVERFYNPRSGEHFYTAGAVEQSVLRASGVWRDEGVAFRMSSDKGTPVYRLYNPGGKHLFTTSERERDALIKAKWNYEGVAFYVPDGAKTDVHRLYNPGNGDHLLTTSANERGVLVMHKWRDEGIAFKAE